jgi:DNA processing protein
LKTRDTEARFMSLRHWLQLALTDGIGPILQTRLVETAGGAEAACAADGALLRNVDGIGSGKATKIRDALRHAATLVDDEIAKAHAAGAAIICRDDDTYPPLLKLIPDPPPVLYVRGTIEPRDLNAVGIVGSRKCSYYGREQSERFAALLAGAGVTVVSGGARGIDSAAHRGAISHPQGRTIAVLGSGVDVPYPPENQKLFEQIAGGGGDGDGERESRGAAISEYPMGTPPLRDNFPRRNRIISGMSRGILVVEADERSGALITARMACDDHGRPVFALPGRVDSPTSAGPHKLIRDGAVLARGLEDIVEALGPLPQEVREVTLFEPPVEVALETVEAPVQETPIGLSERQRAIFAHLGADPVDVDTIIDRTALPAQLVMQELTFLSLKGIVKRVDGQLYAAGRSGRS